MRLPFFVACLASLVGGSCSAASTQTPTTSAPPWKCELRLSAWCIAEGSYEINRQSADDGVHDRVWSMRGRFRPESKLIVLEPNGCGNGLSDTARLMKFEKGVARQGRSWDQLLVRLKSDASCDLTILLPPDDGDTMEWAFTSGLPLVRPCKNDACDGEGLGQIKPELLRLRKGN